MVAFVWSMPRARLRTRKRPRSPSLNCQTGTLQHLDSACAVPRTCPGAFSSRSAPPSMTWSPSSPADAQAHHATASRVCRALGGSLRTPRFDAHDRPLRTCGTSSLRARVVCRCRIRRLHRPPRRHGSSHSATGAGASDSRPPIGTPRRSRQRAQPANTRICSWPSDTPVILMDPILKRWAHAGELSSGIRAEILWIRAGAVAARIELAPRAPARRSPSLSHPLAALRPRGAGGGGDAILRLAEGSRPAVFV